MSGERDTRVLRASDQDRHEAVLALSDHFAEGRLDREEFDVRMAVASEATYLHDLDPIFADLPTPTSRTPSVTSLSRTGHGRAGAGALGRRRGHPRLHLLPVAFVLVFAVVLLAQGHALWALLALWWVAAAVGRRRAWRRYDVLASLPGSRHPLL